MLDRVLDLLIRSQCTALHVFQRLTHYRDGKRYRNQTYRSNSRMTTPPAAVKEARKDSRDRPWDLEAFASRIAAAGWFAAGPRFFRRTRGASTGIGSEVLRQWLELARFLYLNSASATGWACQRQLPSTCSAPTCGSYWLKIGILSANKSLSDGRFSRNRRQCSPLRQLKVPNN